MNIQQAFSAPVFYPPPYVWIPRARGFGAIDPNSRIAQIARRYGIPTQPGEPFRFASKAPSLRGLGDAASAQQINTIVTTGASTTVGILVALGTVGGPIGAAVSGLIAVGSLIANMFHGCGSSCVIASQDANKFEQPLQQNLSIYLNAPVHTKSMQAAALNNADTLFNALRTACSDPSLGTAGQNCISERLNESSCKWQASPGGWSQDSSGNWSYKGYGAAGSGTACWNWVIGYRDPIANDPTVVDDSAVAAPSGSSATTAAGSTSSGTSSSSGSPAPASAPSLLPVFAIGGLILLAIL